VVSTPAWVLLSVLLLVSLCSACTAFPSPPPSITAPPSPPPSVTASPPPPPPATASPSPAPRLTPSLVATVIAEGTARTASVQPLCLRQEDTDGDGQGEWVGLYLQPGEPPQLLGFVLDGEDWHDLRPPENEEVSALGEYPTCEMTVDDINADGRVEIAVWGHAPTADLLHIFAWDGAHYALLGGFVGKGGVRLESAGGDLADQVVVRWRPEGDLVWEVVYTWDGTHYAWTWDRYAWFYLDRPHVYPTDTPLHAVVSFYLALDDRDLPAAYGLLSPAVQAGLSYNDWAWNFNTTLGVEVGALQTVQEEGDQATLAGQVRALDNVSGRIIATTYAVEWQVVRTPNGWRIAGSDVETLEQREITYYP